LPQNPDKYEQSRIDSAVSIAGKADVVILVLGGNTRTAGENKSRTSLDLPGFQMDMVKAIHQTGKKIIFVLIGFKFNRSIKKLEAMPKGKKKKGRSKYLPQSKNPGRK